MPGKFEVTSFGFKLVSTKFTRMGADAANAKPAFEKVADYVMSATEKTFTSQGRRGGGSWKRLSKKWLFRKTKLGKDTRILYFDQTLRRSVTRRKAKGQVLIITPNSMLIESKLDYAATHQFGDPGRGIPKRSFIKMTAHDRKVMRDMVRDHLMRTWRKGGEISGTRR